MALTTAPVELVSLDGSVTINDSSADVDFRVESDGNQHMLFVDAGNDRVHIGKSTSGLANQGVEFEDGQIKGTATNQTVQFLNRASSAGTILDLRLDNTTKGEIAVESTGLVINEASADLDFRIESDSNANMFLVDAGNERVQIANLLLGEITGSTDIIQSTSSDGLLLDVAGDIILDADGADILLKDGGTQFGKIGKGGGSDLIIDASIADKDIFLMGTDGSSAITALTLDMSNAGAATFNDSVTASAVTSTGGMFSGGSNGGIRIHSGGAKFFNVTAANAAQDATMDIGAADARFKDLYLSGGAFIGGTGTANQLDDYEEGNWTPTIQSTGTATFSNASYTKVGRLVTAHCIISSISNTSSTNTFAISLPFSAGLTDRATTIGSITSYVAEDIEGGYVASSGVLYLYINSTGAYRPLKHSDFQASPASAIYLAFTYMAT